MNVVALECCTETCSVAACVAGPGGWSVWWRGLHQPGQQLAVLAPLLEELLGHPDLAGMKWDRVCVTRGPGTFTGVRIGLATARTLAQVWSADMLALDTLDTLACNVGALFPANAQVEHRFVAPDAATAAEATVVLDARKREIFVSAYGARSGEDWPRPVWGPLALGPDELAAQPHPGRLLGSGLARYAERLGGSPMEESHWWPSAAHLALAGAGAYRGVPAAQSWQEVTAFYLRAPDAEIPLFMRASP